MRLCWGGSLSRFEIVLLWNSCLDDSVRNRLKIGRGEVLVIPFKGSLAKHILLWNQGYSHRNWKSLVQIKPGITRLFFIL
jgi:hypothetical protein